MQFSSLILAAFAGVAAAQNIIEFVNQDSTARTVTFTQNEGLAAIPALEIAGDSVANVTFPESWIGNWFSVSEGAPTQPGMLGEVAWNAFMGITFFDVSAIVNPDDNNGVKMIFPKLSAAPVSGCQTFPCDHAYNKPDDVQTLSTTETTLICLLGTSPTLSPAVARRHPRHFVLHGDAHTM
jgi:hypothetical protein